MTISTNKPATTNEPVPSDAPSARSQRARRARRIVESYALLILVLVVVAFFSVLPSTRDTFPTLANLQVTVGSQAVVAIVALGALVPLICDQWDLSVGASTGLSAIFVATMFRNGYSLPIAIAAGVGCGLVVGAVNALIVTRLRVNAIITTLGISTIIAGAVNQKTGGLSVNGNLPTSIINFGTQNFLGVPILVYAVAVVALAVYYLLEHTPVGRYIYALGSNPEAANLVGLRTGRLVAGTFLVTGLLCGAAGVLQVAHAGGADPRAGELLTLPALAAAFLSAASIKPGRYNVWGTLVALAFLASINSGLNLAGVPPYVNSYVNGTALIIGVALAAALARERAAGRN